MQYNIDVGVLYFDIVQQFHILPGYCCVTAQQRPQQLRQVVANKTNTARPADVLALAEAEKDSALIETEIS